MIALKLADIGHCGGVLLPEALRASCKLEKGATWVVTAAAQGLKRALCDPSVAADLASGRALPRDHRSRFAPRSQ